MRLLRFSFALLVLTLAGCAPSPEVIQTAVQGTLAALPTFTPLPSLTPAATYTPLPTYTPYPSPTPTITDTPTPEFTPKPWQDMTVEELRATDSPLIVDHPPGFYLIEVDIYPGFWRSENTGRDDCYWEITDASGKIIDNHYGLSGGTVFVPIRLDDKITEAYQVQFGPGCGTWKYLYLVPGLTPEPTIANSG